MTSIVKSLQVRNLHQFDPIAHLLIEKLRFSPLTFWLFFMMSGTFLYLFTAWVSDTLWSTSGQVGLLQDPLPWIWVLFVNPIVVGYYLWSFQAISDVIRGLERSDVLNINASEIEEINETAFRVYQGKWRKWLSLGSTAVFSIFVYSSRFRLTTSWTRSHWLPILAVTLTAFAVVYMGSMLVLNLISNIRILHCILKRELQRREFRVNPLHPDRCGGLRSLSNYALKTAYLAAVFGLMVGFIEYQFIIQGLDQRYWFVHLLIPLVILLSFVCFFGPLLAAHRGMKRAKEDLLHEIAKQFQTEYSQLHSNLNGDAELLKKGAEKIKELRAFYTLTDEFPVWPFDVQTFRRFLLTISAPIVPFVVGILQKSVTFLLKQQGIELG